MEGVALKIRDADVSDVKAISDIYNHYVVTSTATFALVAETLDERQHWFDEHQAKQLPVIVVESQLDGSVVAWGSLSFYHNRCGYKNTMEPSVYVHRDHVKQGLGREVMGRLIELARMRDCHCLVGLACAENESSIRMSEAMGFQIVGQLKEVGWKFDRWLDVTILQMLL